MPLAHKYLNRAWALLHLSHRKRMSMLLGFGNHGVQCESDGGGVVGGDGRWSGLWCKSTVVGISMDLWETDIC